MSTCILKNVTSGEREITAPSRDSVTGKLGHLKGQSQEKVGSFKGTVARESLVV